MSYIGVVTFCYWSNFGSMLQAAGLNSMLEKLGHKTVLIQNDPQPSENLKIRYMERKKPKEIPIALHKFFIRNKQKKVYRENQEFMNTLLNCRYFEDYQELVDNPPNCDIFLAGSDQIWNPNRCLPICFLDFVDNNKKKISYAASMGTTVVPNENRDRFRKLVNNIDMISVREVDNADVMRDYTDKDISVNIDPVFLKSADEWRELSSKYDIGGDYILVYAIYWDKTKNDKLKEMHEKTGMPVILVTSQLRGIYANKVLYDVSVREFIYLVDHAKYVVSSSFHGTAMAILFNKVFIPVVNPGLPSRITSLLETLCIKPLTFENYAGGISYEEINRKIENERIKAERYLKNAIDGE